MAIKTGHFHSINAIKDANENAGYFFFEPSTMRGFRSRIHTAVYGGCAFVTSEQFSFRGRTDPREYRVRVVMHNGSIVSLDDRFSSRGQAHSNAKWLGESLRNGTVTCDPTTGKFVYHSAYGDAPLKLS